MRRMPLTDAFFLLSESRRTPMHVGGLNLFTLPKDVDDASFLANLGNILRWDGELGCARAALRVDSRRVGTSYDGDV